jgi:hypothetical protein
MMVWSLKVIQLVQEDGGIKLTIVPVPESLHHLMNSLLVRVVEQVCDFSGQVHSFDLGLSVISDLLAKIMWSIVCT